MLGNHDTGRQAHRWRRRCARRCKATACNCSKGSACCSRGWEVLGLGDLWGGDPRGDVARLLLPGTPTVPRLVLAHQPDTAQRCCLRAAPAWCSADTHGGQIMLPWITRHWVLPGMSAGAGFEG